MSLNVDQLLKDMTSAAAGSLKENWPGIKDMATTSLKTLAQNLVDIEKMKASGTTTEAKAALLINMQKSAVKMVIATEEGLGLLAAEAAVNAAIDVVRGAVNTALGGWVVL